MTFSRRDLEDIAYHYNRGVEAGTIDPAPFVPGHPPDDSPAFGKATRVRVDGDSLVVEDAVEVDPTFAAIVNSGELSNRSVKLLAPGHKDNPLPTYRLKHIGFLGITPPAAANLGAVELAEQDSSELEFVFPGGDMAKRATATAPPEVPTVELAAAVVEPVAEPAPAPEPVAVDPDEDEEEPTAPEPTPVPVAVTEVPATPDPEPVPVPTVAEEVESEFAAKQIELAKREAAIAEKEAKLRQQELEFARREVADKLTPLTMPGADGTAALSPQQVPFLTDILMNLPAGEITLAKGDGETENADPREALIKFLEGHRRINYREQATAQREIDLAKMDPKEIQQAILRIVEEARSAGQTITHAEALRRLNQGV